jgi:hypothetical protein
VPWPLRIKLLPSNSIVCGTSLALIVVTKNKPIEIIKYLIYFFKFIITSLPAFQLKLDVNYKYNY